jgi:hypothetical protein
LIDLPAPAFGSKFTQPVAFDRAELEKELTMINNTRMQTVLCAAFSAALLLTAVPAALAAPPQSSTQQVTETSACAHSGLGNGCAEDWDQENIAAR